MKKPPILTPRAVNTVIGKAGLDRARSVATRIRGWHEWTSGLVAIWDGTLTVRRYYCGRAVALRPEDIEVLCSAGYTVDAEGRVTISGDPGEGAVR